MDCANFINTLVVEILDKSLSSHRNYEIGGSYNTLRQCVDRNKNIGKKPIIMISNMITREIYDTKKNKAIDFLKTFLTPTEHEYVQKNPNDIKSLVTFAANKINQKEDLEKNSDNDFIIMDVDQLINIGWTIEEMVRASIDIDFETIDNITEEHNGDLSQWISVVRENSDTLRYLIDKNNKMIGYWHCTPLNNNSYIKAKNGLLLDSEITIDKIPLMLPGETYNIYFIGICLQENYRRKTATFGKLLSSIIEVIQELADKRIYFDEICALAYTNSGVKLCEAIGLKYLKDHIEHGQIYVGKIIDFLDKPFCQREEYEKVRNLYKNKKSI